MNALSVLKAEISRLARKEAKQVVAPVQKASATYRGLIAGLRKQVASLQQEVAVLRKAVPTPEKSLAAKTEPEGRFWITGKGVRAMRKRTGLTQAKFAKLVGVSVPTVVNWEKAKGKLNLRKAAAGALQALRGKGKRVVAEMLGEGKTEKPAAKAKKAKAPKAKKTPKKAKAKKALGKTKKKTKVPKASKAPKAVEKAPEEKTVAETPAEAKKD